jgi:hypothetical protein
MMLLSISVHRLAFEGPLLLTTIRTLGGHLMRVPIAAAALRRHRDTPARPDGSGVRNRSR